MQFHQRRERQGKQPINIWASNIWTEKNHYPVTFIMALCLKYDSLRLFPLPRQFLRGVSHPSTSGSTPSGLKIRTSHSRGGSVGPGSPSPGDVGTPADPNRPQRHREGRGSPWPLHVLTAALCPAAELLNRVPGLPLGRRHPPATPWAVGDGPVPPAPPQQPQQERGKTIPSITPAHGPCPKGLICPFVPHAAGQTDPPQHNSSRGDALS